MKHEFFSLIYNDNRSLMIYRNRHSLKEKNAVKGARSGFVDDTSGEGDYRGRRIVDGA